MTSRGALALTLIALLCSALGACNSAQRAHRAANVADDRALRRCTLLLPLAYNDGTPIPAAVLTAIQNRLYDRFGGYTTAGRVTGACRLADGTRASDESLELWIAVPAGRIAELRREITRFCRELRQESLYFEVSDAAVELVGPAGR